jgi:hypothetical protein
VSNVIGWRVMDLHELRAVFDRQVRRNTSTLMPGVADIRADDGVVRELAAPGQRMSAITWAGFDRRNADDVIAAQVDFFRRRHEAFEWKVFGYDQPADLGERLRLAGFVPDDEEVLLFADTARIACDVPLPEGIRLVAVHDEAGVEAATTVQEDLEPGTERRARHVRGLLAGLADEREPMVLVLAMAGDEPATSARIDFGPGTEFAGLFSASTSKRWRGHGIYRAIVAYRARLAAARGFPYLRVETTTMSRPILRRLGFEPAATVTPYVWTPSD